VLEAAVDHQAGRSIAVPTALFPMRPIGQETSEVESIYSYIMRLGLAHSLPSRKIVERLATLPDWRRLGLSLGRQWNYRHGLPLMGVGQVASRWASILEVATGANGLQFCTHWTLAFVCGIGLVARKARVCLQCLSEDEAQGREPYENFGGGCCSRVLPTSRELPCHPCLQRAQVQRARTLRAEVIRRMRSLRLHRLSMPRS
jgi:hypothetical protein